MKLIKDDEGYALLIVLWSLVILGVIFSNLTDESHLNNLLIRNSLDNKEVDQTLVSGIKLAINKLINDKTDYDTKDDQIFKAIETNLNGVNCLVEIKDVGSKLNINYISYNILDNFSWWNAKPEKKFKKFIKEKGLIYKLSLLKKIVPEHYDEFSDFSTIYGKFNLNTGNLVNFQILADSLEVPIIERNKIIAYIIDQRRTDKLIKEVNNLKSLLGKGLSVENFKKLKPYLTTKSQININYVNQEILEFLLPEVLNIDNSEVSDYSEEIIEYRKQEKIEEIKQLKFIFPNLSVEQLKEYFSNNSKYFLIKSRVPAKGQFKQEIRAVVHRYKDNLDNWKIEVVRWNKNYNWNRGEGCAKE